MTAIGPLRQTKIRGYAVGDLGINWDFQMIGFYLTYFYTDVYGISTAPVAGLFLLPACGTRKMTRSWDISPIAYPLGQVPSVSAIRSERIAQNMLGAALEKAFSTSILVA